ncbi:MAG: hypothetical protein IKG21_10270 [Atopobiaceae bacterium]|nr:hypothetical protein [Atopobiaceae bacterium]
MNQSDDTEARASYPDRLAAGNSKGMRPKGPCNLAARPQTAALGAAQHFPLASA